MAPRDDVTDLEDALPSTSAVGLVVVVLSGVSKGAKKRVGAKLRIGKAPDNDLVLHESTVSRYHCEITRVSGTALSVRDLGSRNGTRVGGARVREAEVRAGTTLSVGGVDLVLQPSVEPLETLPSDNDHFGDAIGPSLAMRRVFGVLEYVAPSDATVLITGESGTGKEVLARSIVKKSRRAKKPLVVVDCSAVSGPLLDSELFGHVKGAFTGAQNAREGAFERADGGTIFLDEIGGLPLEVQPKFLRVLERREFMPLGSNKVHRVDVRVIASTVRDLTKDVEAGRFREDLWFRLAIVPVRIPPLRERREDVPRLVAHFLDDRHVAPEAMEYLVAQDWPGNVRELRNVLSRAQALAGADGPIELAHFGMRALEMER